MANAYKGETLDAITLEGVQITNKNFSGMNGRFDDGKRTFTVKRKKQVPITGRSETAFF